jgi:outer membrane protein assembly factor BamB
MSDWLAARLAAPGLALIVLALLLLGRPDARAAAPAAPGPPGRPGAQVGGPWPQFHLDAQHTGRSPFEAPLQPTARWRLPRWSTVGASPIVAADGRIYLTADGYLYALEPDGSERWRVQTGGCQGTAAVSPGAVVYVTGTTAGGVDAALHAIDQNGRLLWTFDAPGTRPLPFSTALGPDGTIYFGVGSPDGASGALYAVWPDGRLKWKHVTAFLEGSTPAIAPDGTVYVGSAGDAGVLYAVRPDGSPKWQFATGGRVNSSPLVAGDGAVYVGSADGRLHALEPDGRPRWSVALGPIGFSSPALGADGTVYVGAGDALVAVRSDGTVAWRASCLVGGLVESSPAVGRDGAIVFQTGRPPTVSGGAVLCALEPDGRRRWSFQTEIGRSSGQTLVSSPAIAADGLLYVGSPDGSLQALADLPVGAPPPPGVATNILSAAATVRRTCGSVQAGALTVGVPTDAVASDTLVAVEPRPTPPPAGSLRAILAFALEANRGLTNQFARPVALVVRYDDASLGGIDEATLTIYTVAAGGARQALPCQVDAPSNTLRCTTDHFSDFEVAGSTLPPPTPRPTPTTWRFDLPLVPRQASGG